MGAVSTPLLPTSRARKHLASAVLTATRLSEPIASCRPAGVHAPRASPVIPNATTARPRSLGVELDERISGPLLGVDPLLRIRVEVLAGQLARERQRLAP